MDFRVRIRYGFRVGFAKKLTTHQVRSQYVGLFSVMLYSCDRRATEPHETKSKCMISWSKPCVLTELQIYTLFFYKNIFYKNTEPEICKILRTF